MNPRASDLNHVVRKMSPLLRQLVGDAITFRTKLGSDLGAVQSSPLDLEQIVTELTGCCRRALARGGEVTLETGNVAIEAEMQPRSGTAPTGHYVALSISIRAYDARELSMKELGVCLGTVRDIVEECGAYLQTRDKSGHTHVLEVLFRRLDDPPRTHAQRRETKEHDLETILLVEDEKPVRELARMILERHGYRVLVAKNGREAIRVSKGHDGPIHLILADVVMPQMGGPETVEQLHRSRPGIRVLFLSGYSDKVFASNEDTAFGKAYLQKPFTMDSLSRKVREVLDSSAETPPV